MDAPPEQLSNGPIGLRRWRAADADVCFRLVTESIDHLAPWMPWAANGYDRAEAEGFLARCEQDWDARTAFQYLILSDGEPAGSAGLMARIGPGCLEIGYWVHRAFTRRGVATAAAGALTEAGLALPGISHIEIHHDQLNAASERVPAKLGYTHVDTLREARFELAPADSGISKVWRFPR